MSAVDSSYLRVRDDNDNHRRSLSGLTLDAVLSEKHHAPPPPPVTRTLLDIIRDEEPRRGSYKGLIGHKDKKSWKSFMDGIRLKRAGEAWTTSFPVPASDIPIHSISRPINVSRRSPVRYQSISNAPNESTHPNDPSPGNTAPAPAFTRPQFSRQGSSRVGLSAATQTQLENSSEISPRSEAFARPSRPQFSRHNSTRTGPTSSDPTLLESSVAEDDTEQPRGPTRRLSAALAEERALSAREVVADQEAEEAESAAAAAAAAAAAEEEEEEAEEEEAGTAEAGDEEEPVRMSLMDLLEETDRQMGLVGSRYTVGDEEYEEEEDEEEEEEEEGDEEVGGRVEYNCCVCMVRHKGAAFIPCGHTFCRLCSRELWVQRGNCPLCNGFILEILDIF